MLSDGLTHRQAFEAAYATWHGAMPIFHYSEGINGTRKHADYAQQLPPDYDMPVVWEVELKAKDKAIKRMMKMHEVSVH
jgi:UV DNA damage repair endonuclease